MYAFTKQIIMLLITNSQDKTFKFAYQGHNLVLCGQARTGPAEKKLFLLTHMARKLIECQKTVAITCFIGGPLSPSARSMSIVTG